MANNEFVLDINKKSLQHPTVVIRQGDANLNKVNVIVTDNGVPVNLGSYTLTFMGMTPAGTKIIDTNGFQTTPGGLSTGQFTYAFPSAAASAKGVYENAYFKLQTTSGITSTIDINIRVLGGVDLNSEDAENYVTIVDKVIQDTKDALVETNSNIDNANDRVDDLQQDLATYSAQATSAAAHVQSVSSSAVTEVNSAAASAAAYIDSVAPDLDTYAKDDTVVHKSGPETIVDTKTFTSSPIIKQNVSQLVFGSTNTTSQLPTLRAVNRGSVGSGQFTVSTYSNNLLMSNAGEGGNAIFNDIVNTGSAQGDLSFVTESTENNIVTADSDGYFITNTNNYQAGTYSGHGIFKFGRDGTLSAPKIIAPNLGQLSTNNTWTGNNSFSGLNTYNGVTDTPLQTLDLLNGVTGTINYKIKSGMITLNFENVNLASATQSIPFATIPNIPNLGRLIRFRPVYKTGYITMTLGVNGTIYLASTNNQTIDNTFTIYETISFAI